MANVFKDSYVVQNSNEILNNKKRVEITNENIEQAYLKHVRLKNDPKFMQTVIDTFLSIAISFKKSYPHVTIQSPRGRIKSDVSIKNKLKNMEIERICKLYAIDKISDSEKVFLEQAILELIKNSKEDADAEYIKNIVDKIKIIFDGEPTNLEAIKYIAEQPISEKAKTALLRITKSRLQKEKVEGSQELQEEISQISIMQETDEITGKKIFYDILKWKDIEEINPQRPDYKEKVQKLHNPEEYLVLKDLIGMKIVVCDIPDSIETDNQELKTLIQIRKKVKDLVSQKEEQVEQKKPTKEEIQEIEELKEQYNEYYENCRIEIIKEFGAKLRDEEMLNKLHLKLEKYKSKCKENGYRAEHFKYSPIDNPKYKFEIQFRPFGSERASRIGHCKRDGKKIRNIYNVPQYFALHLNKGQGTFSPHLYSRGENMESFLRGYMNDEELDKLIEESQR